MTDGHEMCSSVINTFSRNSNHITDTNCDLVKDISSIQKINDEMVSLGMENLKLSWDGDFESLKRAVNHCMKFDGIWKSHGNEKKVCSNGDTTIIWWKRKKFLLVEGKQAKGIIDLFILI